MAALGDDIDGAELNSRMFFLFFFSNNKVHELESHGNHCSDQQLISRLARKRMLHKTTAAPSTEQARKNHGTSRVSVEPQVVNVIDRV